MPPLPAGLLQLAGCPWYAIEATLVCLTPLNLLPNLCLPWIYKPCRQRALPPGD
jgi:hypothetical protein